MLERDNISANKFLWLLIQLSLVLVLQVTIYIYIDCKRKFEFYVIWITNNISKYCIRYRAKYSWQRDPSAQVGPPSFQSLSGRGAPMCTCVSWEMLCFHLAVQPTIAKKNVPRTKLSAVLKQKSRVTIIRFSPIVHLDLSNFSIIIQMCEIL